MSSQTSSSFIAPPPATYTESFAGYLDTMVELSNPKDNTRFLRSYDTQVYSTWHNLGGGDHPINLSDQPLRCIVHLQINDNDVEPSVESVCQCSGQFFDAGPSAGIRFTVLQWSVESMKSHWSTTVGEDLIS